MYTLRNKKQRSQQHCPLWEDVCKTFTHFLPQRSSHETPHQACCQSQVTKNWIKMWKQQQARGREDINDEWWILHKRPWGQPCLPYSGPLPTRGSLGGARKSGSIHKIQRIYTTYDSLHFFSGCSFYSLFFHLFFSRAAPFMTVWH